jgi:hypothetical protein
MAGVEDYAEREEQWPEAAELGSWGKMFSGSAARWMIEAEQLFASSPFL